MQGPNRCLRRGTCPSPARSRGSFHPCSHTRASPTSPLHQRRGASEPNSPLPEQQGPTSLPRKLPALPDPPVAPSPRHPKGARFPCTIAHRKPNSAELPRALRPRRTQRGASPGSQRSREDTAELPTPRLLREQSGVRDPGRRMHDCLVF
ncbi:uncharacterized protein LOC110393634 isoform X4 [Numida meleagris]|uniref:uncharacterized protein LOC110393634 isoform X4 n=1 Tax=Numida meleagris TaxID=8996 RepID=UPI000B3DD404|nr:uncharacterized protein LOC110393634 isoform X4 [Numida meleagris]